MSKIFTVAILGVGARGGDIYGTIMAEEKENFSIVALCDNRPLRLEHFSEIFNVKKENCFTDENEFFKEKRADLIIIATQDGDHVRHMLMAFEKGYDILVEKPLTDSEEECKMLLNAHKKYGGKVLVCHVLRYAPPFRKVGELLQEKTIGDLVCIDATERVSYWHQAHSFVRGNWKNDNFTAPMIIAKCCHDLDLLQHYAGARCKSISSMGGLYFFNKEHMPKDASERCCDCIYNKSCPYSGEHIYIERWKNCGKPENCWPYNIITSAPVTEKKMREAMKTGDYGKCVFCSDNNVVDHQITCMTFENNVKASLTMTAFTADGGRRLVFHGTLGEIVFDETLNTINIHKFGKEEEIIDVKSLSEGGYGHGGGDKGLISNLYDILNGDQISETSLEASIESHIMGIYAEKSRLKNGELMVLHKN